MEWLAWRCVGETKGACGERGATEGPVLASVPAGGKGALDHSPTLVSAHSAGEGAVPWGPCVGLTQTPASGQRFGHQSWSLEQQQEACAASTQWQ